MSLPANLQSGRVLCIVVVAGEGSPLPAHTSPLRPSTSPALDPHPPWRRLSPVSDTTQCTSGSSILEIVASTVASKHDMCCRRRVVTDYFTGETLGSRRAVLAFHHRHYHLCVFS